MRGHYRHTKIVATLGPSTESDERLAELIDTGVDVMRLNMAHATGEWVEDIVSRIRNTSTRLGRQVAVMMDVKGPEIRTGVLDEPIELRPGQLLELHTDSSSGGTPGVASASVNYADLPSDVFVDGIILVDSGLLRMRVVEKSESQVVCEILTPGTLQSRRHINLPGVQVNLPALTEKDRSDLTVGIAQGIDFVALSFVRQASDIRELRRFLDSSGSSARIVAKIEDQAGVRNMSEIVREADGVMVARGDLGIEIDYHKLPLVQSQLVQQCQTEGKPVIVATHLLESMVASPMPTRAEISDVSNAIREQADAVMLSGETTTGSYPLESVEVLKEYHHQHRTLRRFTSQHTDEVEGTESKNAASRRDTGAGVGAVGGGRLHEERVSCVRPGSVAGRGRADLRLHRRRSGLSPTAASLGRRAFSDAVFGGPRTDRARRALLPETTRLV